MSRSNYSDYCDDDLAHGRWRAQVMSATRGKRGQAFFREMIEALDAMSGKRLIAHELRSEDGEVCAIGAVGMKRGTPMGTIDPEDYETVGKELGVAHQLVQEIVYMNDEYLDNATPELRWAHMRAWAEKQLKQESP